jgi:RNA polymerase sigma-70 factor (ECF subfamily)
MQTDLQMEPDSASELRNATMIARNGDSSAFEAIMRRHNQRLYRIARAILRDDAEAEDIVQEAYIKAFTHGDSFKGQGNLGAWLAKVTANFAISRLRQLNRRRTETLDTGTLEQIQSEGIFSPGHMSPERRAAMTDIKTLLQREIDQLPDGFREVFVLREVEGMSIVETADALAILPQTVKTRLHRAKALLRASLETTINAAALQVFPFAGKRCDAIVARVLKRIHRDSHPGNKLHH